MLVKEVLKKIIWNHSKAERVYDKLIANQEKPILESIIGKGGFGEVYKGKWKLQDVAIKKLNLNPYNISETDIKNFKKEVNILKNLKNKYIIQYYGVYFDDQELLIIMEYAEKSSLTNFINNNQDKEHDWDLNTNLIKQMALGLAYIHHENIIHCDLKSLNILLTSGSEVKISDFGLSKTKIVSASQAKHNLIGSLRWMAPEILREKKYSEQSDIYSLGMIIWEIVAKCTVPFKDMDDKLVYIYIISDEKETIPHKVPESVHDIIEQCWKSDPSERISLENILKKVRSGNLDSYLLEPLKSSKSQSTQRVNDKACSEALMSIDSFEPIYSQNKRVESNEKANIFGNNLEEVLTTEFFLSAETQGDSKSIKLGEVVTEPIEVDYNTQNQDWTNHSLTSHQIHDWLNIGLQSSDYSFASWLHNYKHLTPEEVLNNGNEAELRIEYQTCQSEFQTHQEIPPK